MSKRKNMDRREFLKRLGTGGCRHGNGLDGVRSEEQSGIGRPDGTR